MLHGAKLTLTASQLVVLHRTTEGQQPGDLSQGDCPCRSADGLSPVGAGLPHCVGNPG